MKIVYLYNWKNGLKSALPSDTLWGNLCWGLLYLFGEDTLQKFLNSYNSEQPELIISSTFPYYQTSKYKKLFFPKPLLPLSTSDKLPLESNQTVQEKIQNMSQRKKLKKYQHIEYNDFQKILSNSYNIQNVALEKAPTLVNYSITRNTINRFSGGTLKKEDTGQLFVEDFYFIDTQIDYSYSETTDYTNEVLEDGLFFLCHDKTEGKLEAVLRLLSHWGIGGNKTIGKGIFELRIEEIELMEPQNANAMINLSLYHPTQEELKYYKSQNLLFHYQLEMRKGYYGKEMIENKYEKKPLFYFKEGSLFPLLEKEYYGKNVIELEKIHRYGMPLMIKIFVSNSI